MTADELGAAEQPTRREQQLDPNASDSVRYPWAQDLDGVWHKRPPGKPWVTSDDGPNCETVCGKWIASANVSLGWMLSTMPERCANCYAAEESDDDR
jgi:hypothetical protein